VSNPSCATCKSQWFAFNKIFYNYYVPCSQAKVDKKWPNKEFMVDKQADGSFENIVFDTLEPFGEHYSLQNLALSDYFLIVYDGLSTC